ncbi:hypothetical protein BO94DRAFT_611470 [Aspergillus sclerotioniger CBS 115572]|uniref:Leucine-rich repeat domain-containing protein n=1 Tax=Aspergillus sclerotioniger CBS 115572 TaxID=1450535 RepID=A0A317V2M3_9EURO|nr:hypothetical protein BO94DRAFT_611470 [Aspergillus sclerotioniger CBS 115572]PWY68523.1 hypothetical protein BO94DRAFT_611470 [Aspergillus sclerotioniger CBS 115572]
MRHLPPELLCMIGNYVDDKPTQRALAECSRYFHNLFMPRLYSSIEPFTSIPYTDAKPSQLKSSRTFALIRLLWSRPDLARHVQHMEFHLHNGYRDAWVGVLLTRLSRLKTITAHACPIALDINLIFEKAALRQSPFHRDVPFPHLNKVRFVQLPGHYPVYAETLIPFFYFPALRSVEGLGVRESLRPYVHPKLRGIKNIGSPVREITVSGPSHFRTVGLWIEACSNLERVHVNIEPSRAVDLEWYQSRVKGVRKSLLPAKRTLKSLCLLLIDFRVRSHYLRDHYEALRGVLDGPFGSFKEFEVLEHLSIRHPNLVTLSGEDTGGEHSKDGERLIDLLPRSLKSLEITEIQRKFLAGLIADILFLGQHRESSVPCLESIALVVIEEWPPYVASLKSLALMLDAGRIYRDRWDDSGDSDEDEYSDENFCLYGYEYSDEYSDEDEEDEEDEEVAQ